MNGNDKLKSYIENGNYRWQITKNSRMVKFRHHDQAEWLLLIADLLRSGFSLRHAVEFSGTILKRHQLIFHKINIAMGEGKTFADCLKPYIKPNLYYQLLLAERHGSLEECLQEVGKLMVLQEKQRQKLMTLLQYPLILIFLLVGLMVALKFFVFPELSQWQGGNHESSENYYLLEMFAYFGGSFFVLGCLTVLRWVRLNQLQKINALCSLPIIGKCYRLYYGYYVVTNLAMMIRHGLTIKEICSIIEENQKQSFLSLLGKITKDAVNQGQKLETIFHDVHFLPDELRIIVEKGSTLSNLGQDLTALANILFQRLTKRIERLLMLIQPVVFGVIALVIIGLYLRLLLPIYDSMQGVI
ncbi:competence type IV pilus assembly protein ComGB [Limosilactobacillus fastidiosus]|uniref:Type II secretion system F family protein n=1 Tax=Limosilactobacillus fastidiosus TaxID=2759855 RepID=A0A7W3TYA7_9LACO|nr:competence type IV pilus assembly protein ComGB [Limosilactobacillus fastidiosus]MBB1062631.1 type II secretion system F family protein [Limosilactobacillus fastidiosus]MBB1085447.1 type II secretion system F family protein [Limosilactobacillus fastidiosus]MCD7083799.1 type II secretion system F family protein [Limosilactobacillus fastidiosus]MCD7085349.1 type II secretion system F family protein [Limosilactobacillus fastidiosus]MCD7114077.1 type II secretion system F family protein [Limosi